MCTCCFSWCLGWQGCCWSDVERDGRQPVLPFCARSPTPSWLGMDGAWGPPAPDPQGRGSKYVLKVLACRCCLSCPPKQLAQTAGAGNRWEQTSELHQGIYWSRDVYCIQNLASPLFMQIYPMAVGFTSPLVRERLCILPPQVPCCSGSCSVHAQWLLETPQPSRSIL